MKLFEKLFGRKKDKKSKFKSKYSAEDDSGIVYDDSEFLKSPEEMAQKPHSETKKAAKQDTAPSVKKEPTATQKSAPKAGEKPKPTTRQTATAGKKNAPQSSAKKAPTAPVKSSHAPRTVAEKTSTAQAKKPAAQQDRNPSAEQVKKPVEATESVHTSKHTRSGRFEIKKSKDGRFVFNLYASNSVIIATSQVYSSASSAMTGIKSVIANAASSPIEDQTVKDYRALPYPKWEIYLDKGNQYRFRLCASNGSCVCHSQGYTAKSNCKKGIESIIKFASDAEISKAYLDKN